MQKKMYDLVILYLPFSQSVDCLTTKDSSAKQIIKQICLN